MQLVDELSMIYTTCLMLWATFEYGRSRVFGILWGLTVASIAIFITLYYHYLQDPTFHQNAYAILTAIVLIRAMIMQELHLRPYFQRRRREREQQQNGTGAKANDAALSGAELARREKRDKEILRQMWAMVAWGLTVFLGGFAVWNLDNIYCSTLRRWRYDVGLPWGILLEGHGWWHIGTGLGAYSYIGKLLTFQLALNREIKGLSLTWHQNLQFGVSGCDIA
jgi:dihydroceramidase